MFCPKYGSAFTKPGHTHVTRFWKNFISYLVCKYNQKFLPVNPKVQLESAHTREAFRKTVLSPSSLCILFVCLHEKQALLALSQLNREEWGHFRKSRIVCIEYQITWPLKAVLAVGVLLYFPFERKTCLHLVWVWLCLITSVIFFFFFSLLSVFCLFFLSQKRTNLQVVWGESRDSEGNGWIKDLDAVCRRACVDVEWLGVRNAPLFCAQTVFHCILASRRSNEVAFSSSSLFSVREKRNSALK